MSRPAPTTQPPRRLLGSGRRLVNYTSASITSNSPTSYSPLSRRTDDSLQDLPQNIRRVIGNYSSDLQGSQYPSANVIRRLGGMRRQAPTMTYANGRSTPYSSSNARAELPPQQEWNSVEDYVIANRDRLFLLEEELVVSGGAGAVREFEEITTGMTYLEMADSLQNNSGYQKLVFEYLDSLTRRRPVSLRQLLPTGSYLDTRHHIVFLQRVLDNLRTGTESTYGNLETEAGRLVMELEPYAKTPQYLQMLRLFVRVGVYLHVLKMYGTKSSLSSEIESLGYEIQGFIARSRSEVEGDWDEEY